MTSTSVESLDKGDRVFLTREGAKAHRSYIRNRAFGVGAAAGAVALPAALPGGIAAGIGIVSAGTGIGLGAGTVAAGGAAAGGGLAKIAESFLHCPEAGDVGTVVEIKKRWGASGCDYKVEWDPRPPADDLATPPPTKKTSWHLAGHLEKA